MPRKLIINKITSVKAITDNKCVKEVLRCVWSRGSTSAEWTQCFIFMGWASQGQRTGSHKDTTSLFLEAFFLFVCFSWCLILPSWSTTAEKQTNPEEIHRLYDVSGAERWKRFAVLGKVTLFFYLVPESQTPPGWIVKESGPFVERQTFHRTTQRQPVLEKMNRLKITQTGSPTNTHPEN